MTAEIYQPWLEAVDSSAGSFAEADHVELDLHLAGGEVLDHGDHVHDQRLEIEEEAVRRKEQFFGNVEEKAEKGKIVLMCREEASDDIVGKKCAETLRRLLERQQVRPHFWKYTSLLLQLGHFYGSWAIWLGRDTLSLNLGFNFVTLLIDALLSLKVW